MEEERFIMNKKCIVFEIIQLVFVVLVLGLFFHYETKLQKAQVLEFANSILYDVNEGEYENLQVLKKNSLEEQKTLYENKTKLTKEKQNLENEIQSLHQQKEEWEKKVAKVEK